MKKCCVGRYFVGRRFCVQECPENKKAEKPHGRSCICQSEGSFSPADCAQASYSGDSRLWHMKQRAHSGVTYEFNNYVIPYVAFLETVSEASKQLKRIDRSLWK